MEQTASEDEDVMSSESSTSAQSMPLMDTDSHNPSMVELFQDDLQDMQPTDTHAPSMLELFQDDLQAVRSKFLSSPLPPSTQKPSHGHRAGFDAFMTGYTFAVYTTMLTQQPGAECSNDTMLSGVSKMRNCLANRGKGVPIQIAKSHFARTSEGHRRAWSRIQSVFPMTQS